MKLRCHHGHCPIIGTNWMERRFGFHSSGPHRAIRWFHWNICYYSCQKQGMQQWMCPLRKITYQWQVFIKPLLSQILRKIKEKQAGGQLIGTGLSLNSTRFISNYILLALHWGPKKDGDPRGSGESTWPHCFLTVPIFCVWLRHRYYWLAKSVFPLVCLSLLSLAGFMWGDTHSWVLLRVGDQISLYFSWLETLGVGGGRRRNLW